MYISQIFKLKSVIFNNFYLFISLYLYLKKNLNFMVSTSRDIWLRGSSFITAPQPILMIHLLFCIVRVQGIRRMASLIALNWELKILMDIFFFFFHWKIYVLLKKPVLWKIINTVFFFLAIIKTPMLNFDVLNNPKCKSEWLF